MMRASAALLAAVLAALATSASGGLPSIRDSLTHPVHVYEGDDALVTCVVRDAGDNTVMWKKEDRERHSRRVLTAGEARVTADRRFDVLHDAVPAEEKINSGGDVWVLVIKEAKPSDSGIYVCEVNSNPIVRSFHKLSVLSRALQPPENGSRPLLYGEAQERSGGRNHNYTGCCAARNVSQACFGFCNIQSILDGNTGQDPEHCERDFPSIVSCMADGRNHVPCCTRQRVPDICQDVCRGEYTVITDNIKTHFSCSAYTEQTLACIAEGVELLPSPPEDVEVQPLTERSINVSWARPAANAESISSYVVNVTLLRAFDQSPEEDADEAAAAAAAGGGWTPAPSPDQEMDSYAAAAAAEAGRGGGAGPPPPPPPPPRPTAAGPAPPPGASGSNLQQVPGTYNSTLVNDLEPFAMYEITVLAKNMHGESLPSFAVRTLTLTPRQAAAAAEPASAPGQAPPDLPDIRACCVEKGISHATCLDKLCNPALSELAEVTDLMICAPWAQQTFSCLVNGQDHTPCCRARGLPPLCLGLCTGNVTQIDFSYFKCLKYMSDYSSCLLQGYGVLPSAPQQVRVSHVDTTFALVHWAPPAALGGSAAAFRVRWRPMSTYDNEYRSLAARRQPFVLEGLRPDSAYEVYVEAVNAHGAGQPSPRVVFRTRSRAEEAQEQEALFYNVTACCVEAGLSGVCMPLCSYDASMADIKSLAGVCAGELSKLLRCGAGGRNHGACCARRGVPAACQSVCAGVLVDPLVITVTTCIPYVGNIVQCFEEGAGLLPGPISELHATRVTDTSVSLEWEPPADGTNVTHYVAHYQKVDNTSLHETLARLENVTANGTAVEIEGLEPGALYNLFVVAHNAHGSSLPSSVLLVNASRTEQRGRGIPGVTSPPHSLAVSGHSATWVTVAWQPPEFSLPAERIAYRLYHKSAADGEFQLVETSVTSHMLEGLRPNTQYIVYVVAVSQKGASLPSETLIAWTDPAYPAFVEPPTVHPINLVMEGSSMTVLCIAMGTPMPTISLYISGRLVRQEVTRHMVTVIHNVTRDMDQISCYADNGYGTPMQASRKITISHVPHITASVITMAALGDSVTLECRVDAHPEPKMLFWRDHSGRVPVIQGGRYDMAIFPDKEEEARYVMRLTIHKIADNDTGEYFCHAENAFGMATQPVSVRIRNVPASNNVTQCCAEQNVTAPCVDACSFYLDVDAVLDKPECLPELDKLMRCAADGSDHRSCCAQSGVPRYCLDWCRGEPILNNKVCVLSHTKQIVSCFHEGRDRLPGPPQNVRVELIDTHSVRVVWEAPVKNPTSVEMYRVFWRPAGSRVALKNDTKATSLRIGGLKEGVLYECVLKAGNRRGTSTLTEPVAFTLGDKYITSAASMDSESSHTGVAVGVVLALVIVAALVAAAVWFLRTRRMLGHKSSGGVAFENPSYLREVNMDHIQIPAGQQQELTSAPSGPPPPHGAGASNGVGPAAAPAAPAAPDSPGGGGAPRGWRTESLHVPAPAAAPAAAAEVAPSLYEELKLGHDGAGFKRLK